MNWNPTIDLRCQGSGQQRLIASLYTEAAQFQALDVTDFAGALSPLIEAHESGSSLVAVEVSEACLTAELVGLGLLVDQEQCERLKALLPALDQDLQPLPGQQDVRQFGSYLPSCVPVATCQEIERYVRRRVELGETEFNDASNRYLIHNDPAARILQRRLVSAVSCFAQRPVKPSYTKVSLYDGGAQLSKHRDREQCEYTISLMIFHNAGQSDGAGICEWPLQIWPSDTEENLSLRQSVGDVILFKGRQVAHGRPPLGLRQHCCTLLLHYVDREFNGTLD